MKKAICRTGNKFTKLPLFEPLLGADKYTDLHASEYLQYFGKYLLELYGMELLEHLSFECKIYTEKEFVAIMAKPEAQRTYFIASLKGKMTLISGLGERCMVRENRIVALSNPLASQTGVSVEIKDCIGKANVHVILVYPKELLESINEQ